MGDFAIDQFFGIVSDGEPDQLPSADAENVLIGKEGQYLAPRPGCELIHVLAPGSRIDEPTVYARDPTDFLVGSTSRTGGVVLEVAHPGIAADNYANRGVAHLSFFLPAGGADPVWDYEDSLDRLFLGTTG